MDLESSASSDEAVRERIASLPPEVSEVQLLSKLEGKMTPLFRINCILAVIKRLRELSEYLEKNKDDAFL